MGAGARLVGTGGGGHGDMDPKAIQPSPVTTLTCWHHWAMTAEHAAEYSASRERIGALLTQDDADVVVPACPAWTVADLCAHLAGVSSDLVNRVRPGADGQAWVDGHVSSRKGRSIDSLLDEWGSISAAYEQLMVDKSHAFAFLLLDIVAHEHDLRHALGRPGGRDERGLVLSMAFEEQLLRKDLAALGDGSLVVRSADGEWTAGEGDARVELDLSDRPHGTFELFRLLGSRRSSAQLAAYPWQGDWHQLRHGIFHMELPASDIVE